MKQVKELKIGILGLGVVGSKLAAQILENAPRIEEEYKIRLIIKWIFVRDLKKRRQIDTLNLPLTDNVNQIIFDPEINVVCECMGGSGSKETRNIIIACLNRNKHVVLSSKKALAQNAELFIKIANSNHLHLKYDATVGGGIPIAKVIENAFKGDEILEISGIFNATSNFIYTQMVENGLSYPDALKIAQDFGYAENDPSEDVDGIDSKNKLVILALFAAHKYVHPDSIKPVSFTSISKHEVDEAQKNGNIIKPVATITFLGGKYQVNIGPKLVPQNSILACTPSHFNTIIIHGKNCGELAFYGQGAGGTPTATAMFDDLIGICQSDDLPKPISFTDVTFSEEALVA